MLDILSSLYPWTKALHVISVIAWMAALFYLPRLFVHHAERVTPGSETDALFQMMEMKLLKVIMTPAMVATWVFGLLLIWTPGVVDWSMVWPWVKAAAVIAMSGFHGWCGAHRKKFIAGVGVREGRYYRIANEVPTLLLIVIVLSVIVAKYYGV